jgi:hypothetical protein
VRPARSGRLGAVSGVQGMALGPRPGLFVEPVDVDLQLLAIDAPHTPATELDGREVAGPHQCVDLRNADVEVGGHVLESQEARLHDRSGPTVVLGRRWAIHPRTIAPGAVGYRYLTLFAAVWFSTRAIQGG